MGVISELVAAFSARRIFGYKLHRLLELGHRGVRLPRLGPPHVRQRPVGLRGDGLLVPELLVAIPSAVKVFNWTATLYKGSISFETPMLYATASSACSRSAA
jgi:cytochrome c oxidase subunit 1